MRQLVLSVSEESDERLRRLAREANGGRKGSLSATVERALLILEKRLRQERAAKRLMAFGKENHVFGVGKFDREEAYS